MLREAGDEVVGTMAFPDHHPFTVKDVARIAAAARSAGVELVATTEKDATRFESLQPLPFRLLPVPLSLVIDGWESLTASLEHMLLGARAPV
jgi:tetraacyldisaccharide 4'-kinase